MLHWDRSLKFFLAKYQSAAPLASFIYDDVTHLLRSLMNRCVKKSVMKDATLVAKLMKIDLDDKDNLCTHKEVEVGATKKLCTAKVTDIVKMNFQMECRKFKGICKWSAGSIWLLQLTR